VKESASKNKCIKKMAGYRCVAFDDLCRLCSNASEKNVQIFSNGDLQKKILECLPISLNEKDRLPKKICFECNEYVQTFFDFRKSTQNAQKLLEGCLNTTKLRNGGQVYIKDETPIKKVLKPIQNPSPTKLIPNLSPVKQIKKNVITSCQNDLISSIMQAVGIQVSLIVNARTIILFTFFRL
jgi:Zinc-finger associated domain (zf-AD)